MQSTALNYQLPTFSGLVTHEVTKTWFVRDTAEETASYSEIDAQVRSGDYFVTLATKLDLIGSYSTSLPVRLSLEDIVSDLMYLQETYEIVKKDEQ